MSRFPRVAPLALALAVALPALAQEASPDPDHAHDVPRTLDVVEVTASPLRQGIEDLARPVDVLTGDELDVGPGRRAQRDRLLGEPRWQQRHGRYLQRSDYRHRSIGRNRDSKH